MWRLRARRGDANSRLDAKFTRRGALVGYAVGYTSTFANATAVASTLFEFKPATHMRPERTR